MTAETYTGIVKGAFEHNKTGLIVKALQEGIKKVPRSEEGP
jgi:hypothetical protein